MRENPLLKLGELGQAIWLDYIQRGLITSGKLKQLINEDGLKGMTSNPAIFEKAIVESHFYEDDIHSMTVKGKSTMEIFEALSQKDISSAADVFRPLYDKSDGLHGYVSLEVNPHLALDTQATIEEGRRLWKAVNRPNIFIKVPATLQGLPAIRQLLSEGINVNITLLFGLPRYRQVAEAHIAGLEDRIAQGKPVNRLASVASFFLSRIDTLLDPQLEKIIAQGGEKAEIAKKILGQVAIASAKEAYQIQKEIYNVPRFQKLASKGAHVQRLLWASTSTKNPKYKDTKYVDALIAPDTINTVPLETLDAYRDHGQPKVRIEEGLDQSRWVLKQLPALGLSIDKTTQQLEDEAVEKFIQPFDKLLKTLELQKK